MELMLSPFEPDMLGPHADLFASYFDAADKLLQEPYLRWLYEKNPHGPALMVRAVEDGRWIAFMAMIPVRLRKQGQEQLAYYVVNVLVHPAHLGRHLFGRLIGLAQAHCKSQGCTLMGHPNALAMPSWKRARMQFRPDLGLRPVLPGLSWGKARKVALTSQADLQVRLTGPVLEGLAGQGSGAELWKPVCEPQYLNWRFLTHPINRYRISLASAADGSSLLCVTRKMKPGLHLLIEAWSSTGNLSGVGRCTPWLTLGAVSDTALHQSAGSLLGFSLRKTMPFFYTVFSAPVPDDELAALSLAASDF